MSARDTREDAFILRISRGCTDAQRPVPWRALVQHVASGERCYCSNFGEIVDFLQRVHPSESELEKHR